MDPGGHSDRWRHRARQIEPVSQDYGTASFGQYDDSEDLPTSPFLSTEPVAPAPISADTPQCERAAATTYEIGPGSVLRNRYLIEKRVGKGGTSEVFSAIDRHRGNGAGSFNKLAIKILHSRYRDDAARTERLIREFRHMQRLTHPGIARVYDLDCDHGLWFITMELLQGRPLSQHIRAGLKDGEALSILTQCAEALAHAHDHAVVHGDLKPSNIFVMHDGSIRLLDFGSVPSRNDAPQTPGRRHFAATPPYASPEMLDGQVVEPCDDIFSLGCVAYELFSGGQHPFSRKSSLDARQQQLRPSYRDSIRPRHFAVIARALSWDRAARPATARDFLHDFLASHFDHQVAPQTATAEPKLPNSKPSDNDAAVAAKASDEAIPAQPQTSGPIDSLDELAGPTEATFAARTQSAATETVAAREPAVRSYEQARARFAEPIPAELLVSTLRFAAEPSLPTRQLTVAGLHRPRWFWIRGALLVTAFALTAAVAVFVRQQFSIRQIGSQPAAQLPVRNVAPGVASTTTVAAPTPAAASVATPADKSVPPPQKQPPRQIGSVAFEATTVRVGPSQSIAAVNVRRTEPASGPTQIVWSTVAGSARPDVDYESVASQVVRFHQGQAVRSLYIAIKHPPGAGQERRFSVHLEKTAKGPLLGDPVQAEIVIDAVPARQL